jgi:hypothetical protein
MPDDISYVPGIVDEASTFNNCSHPGCSHYNIKKNMVEQTGKLTMNLKQPKAEKISI